MFKGFWRNRAERRLAEAIADPRLLAVTKYAESLSELPAETLEELAPQPFGWGVCEGLLDNVDGVPIFVQYFRPRSSDESRDVFFGVHFDDPKRMKRNIYSTFVLRDGVRIEQLREDEDDLFE